VRLGVYEVLELIGQGGAGQVFRARSPSGETVAVKLLVDAGSSEARLRFERERRLLGSFGAREGFVPLLDAGESPSGPFLVMPFVAGGSLRDRLRRGPLAIGETAVLGAALARALGRAHEKGVVHRDLKPENVLFQDVRPLIADLGIAKHFRKGDAGASESDGLSQTGSLRGTLGYFAPEQLRDSKTAGPEADVFALGAVLYECLAGRAAFGGENVLEMLVAIERCEPAPLALLRPDVPPWLARTVERALSREPADRFGDGHELARALEARGSAPRGRRRAILGLALLAAAAGSAWTAVDFAAASRRRESARLAAEARSRLTREHAVPEAELARAVDLDPGSAVALANLAYARAIAGDEAEARRVVARAIELDPGSGYAYYVRARVRDDWKGAIADASHAIELEPGLARAWAHRSAGHRIEGELGSALADAERAVALDSRSALAFGARSQARLAKGDVPGALADATRAVELDPDLADLFQLRSLVKSQAGDLDGAIADATRALEVAPGKAGAWSFRGRQKLRRGDSKGAILDLTRAIELDPRLATAWGSRAEAESLGHDPDAAIGDYTRAIEVDPSLAWAWSGRGGNYGEKGDDARAIADCTRAIELDPRLAVAWGNRAVARVRRNELDAAIADAARAAELDPRLAEAWATLASACGEKGDWDRSIAAATRAIELDPRRAATWQVRGASRGKKNDWDGTVADSTRALELDPGDLSALRNRGAAHARLGHVAEAIADFERCLALAREDPRAPQLRDEITRLRSLPKGRSP
jgi:tetratricopeptide (TPR) repeat protein